MTVDRPTGTVDFQSSSAEPPRLVVDNDDVEWEVYDEATWSIELALEWDFLPQTANPGLIFSSRLGRRRLVPCPPHWRRLSDAEILALLGRATFLF